MPGTTTPQTSMITTLWRSATADGVKTQIGYVQSIPPLMAAADPITYGALDLAEEQQAKGTRKSETVTIPILYTEAQHDDLRAAANSGDTFHWFIQYPESTAVTPGSPLTFSFQASCDLVNDAIEIDGMLQDNLTLYRSTPVTETKGFPTVTP